MRVCVLSGAVVAGSMLVSAAAGGVLSAEGTRHIDGRGTPALYVPAATAPAAVSRITAEDFLRAEHARFRLPADLSNLELVSTRESLLGTHFRYRQVHGGIPVDGAGIQVSLDAQGRVYHVFNETQPVDRLPATGPVRIDAVAALDVAWRHLRVHAALRAAPASSLVYVREGKGFRLAYRTYVATVGPDGYWEHHIDAATGDILSVRDTRVCAGKSSRELPDFSAYTGPVAERDQLTADWYAAQSTWTAIPAAPFNVVNGSGLVFDPDPRTATTNDALLDTSPTGSFASAYVTRTLRDITETNGIYSLTGPWVTITNLEAPNTLPSTTTNGQWTAKRGNNAFNDAMTYFHIDQNQRYLQTLGFSGATGVQYGRIRVDSDGANGDDNSYFIPADNTLVFGHGGVDDNEDADVILHEYGHALTEDIVPGWSGGDTGAIGEGFGDYWGGSYSLTTSNGATHHPEWAFSWDGHGPDTWEGRFMDRTNLTYDISHYYAAHEDLDGVTNYSDQLWSAPLFQSLLRLRQLGRAREEVDRILIESFFHVGSSPKMHDLAAAIVLVAQQLYPTGPHASVFYEKFTNQIILTAYPLPDPTVLRPAAGDVFRTGDVVRVRWNRNGAPPSAAAALAYQSGNQPAPMFQDAMESGTNGWTRSHVNGLKDWALVTTTSRTPTHAWFAGNELTANQQFLVTPAFNLTNGAWLSFWHQYALEDGYDGGLVELTTNGGITWIDIGSNATQNGYSGMVDANAYVSSRWAFTGISGGFVQTLIPLAGYVSTNARIRFQQIDDASYAELGWWVDDVSVGQMLTWNDIATTPTNVSEHLWTLPATASTNYVLRLKLTGSNAIDSAWVQSPAFVVSLDTDGDGLPDAWETRHFASLTNMSWNGDADGDRATDGAEYLAGTLPGSATSVLKTVTFTNSAGGFTIRWNSVSNREYSVARTTNALGGYVTLATNLPATPPQNEYLDTNLPPTGAWIYRIQTP